MPSPDIQEELALLVKKYRLGKATPEEIAFIEQYYAWFDKEPSPVQQLDEMERSAMESRILTKIEQEMDRSLKPASIPLYRRSFFRVAAAAAIIMIFSAGIYLWFIRTLPSKTAGNKSIASLQQDRPPGRDGAILTLADGSTIVLDSIQNGALAMQGNTEVVKQGSQLLYNQHNKAGNGPAWNTVATPRGRQYQLVLADGSKVWLNAASSLRYPTSFTGKERRVQVHGEAYFEVSKITLPDDSREKMPFIVEVLSSSGDHISEIEVLGTHFNVNAYEDEPTVNTTLLEGSVRVKQESSASVILKPGQQSQISVSSQSSKSHQIPVLTVDVDQAIAWKNGHFEFNGNIQGIMRQIARWYDVEVKYTGNVTGKAFGGAISRMENVSQVLKMLEMTGSIHFSIDGDTITVKP